ncbi:MAG TPA: hypothetical protein DCS93_18225 [Microscillaceae bacterium]|nr:hypothetical protein [Microscillaceae bacterium]
MSTIKRIIPYQWLLVIGLLMGTNTSIWAQVTPDIPKSPNAAALEKFAEVPVGHYTGIPNISVPICNLKSRSLSVPISLSYHYTGFKPNEIPSWVGLGWSLNAGGAITRTIQGLPDESPGGYFSVASQIKTSYDPYVFANGGVETPASIQSAQDYNFLKDFAEGNRDGQPDIYSFNVGGYTGKFYIQKTQTGHVAHLMPYQDIKIEIPENFDTGIWKITTPDGNIYEFGGSITDSQGVTTALRETTLSESRPASGQGNTSFEQLNFSSHTSSWFLRSITSANGDDHINFYYNAKNDSIVQFSQSEIHRFVLINEVNSNGNKSICKSTPTPETTNTTTTIFGRLHLAEIVTSVGHKVTFTEGLEREDFTDKRLAEVGLYSLSNQLVKKVKLDYGYLTAGSYKRLLLTQVQEVSPYANSSAAKGAYQFDYHLTGLSPIDTTFEKGIDHWGYYNGANNAYLVPGYVNPDYSINFAGADREVNPEKVKIGVLTAMTYPTGGKASFTWESHQYQHADCSESGLEQTEKVETQLKAASPYDANGDGNTVSVMREITIELDKEQQVIIFAENRRPVDNEGNVTPNIANGLIQILTPVNGDTTNLEEVFRHVSHHATTSKLRLRAGTYKVKCSVDAENNLLDVHAYIRLTYEKQKFLDKNTGCSKPGPGIRIAKVVMSGGLNTGNDIVKEYHYQRFDTPRKSSGMLTSLAPAYGEYQITWNPDPTGQLGACKSCLFYNISGQSKLLLGYSKGSPIVYTQIKVNHGEAGINGYEEYEYTFRRDDLYFFNRRPDRLAIFDGLTLEEEELFGQTKDYDWKRGHLSQQRTFDARGRILNHTINHYLSSDEGGLQAHHHKSKVLLTRMVTGYCDNTFREYTDLAHLVTELESAWHRLDRTEVIQYTYDKGDLTNASQRQMKTETKYFYENPSAHVFVTGTEVTDSEGRVTRTLNRYPQDIYTTETKLYPHADTLKHKHMIGTPLVSVVFRDNKILSATYQEYQLLGFQQNKIYPKASYVTEFATPWNSSDYWNLYNVDANNNFVHFQRKQQYLFDDATGNVKQVIKEDDVTTAFFWGYNQTLMTAQVVNATEQQVAYSSFEQGTDLGHWYIPTSTSNWTLSAVEHYTGTQALLATNGEVTIQSNYPPPATATNVYQLSFWKKGSGAVTVTGVNNLTPVKTLANGWSLYVVEIHRSNMTGGLVELKVSPGVYIDELRLHPDLARMKTFTHTPLVGVNSVTDERNVTAYYEYDALNRLKLIRDFEGNILKRYTYKYKGE